MELAQHELFLFIGIAAKFSLAEKFIRKIQLYGFIPKSLSLFIRWSHYLK